MRNKAIWNVVRTYPIEFALILDHQLWHKTIADMKIAPTEYPKTAASTTFFTSEKNELRPRAIVTMNPREGLIGIQIASMLVHEAQHIVQYVEHIIGEQKFSDEAECYLLQHIAQDLMQDYVDITNRRKHVRKC